MNKPCTPLPGSGGPRLDGQLCFALYSTVLNFGRLYNKLLRPLRLTYPQYLVMLLLWEHEDVYVTQIAERLFLDTATVTPLLKRMEVDGLLYRERDPGDERRVRISLSDVGRRLHLAAVPIPRFVTLATGMSLQEIAVLDGQLKTLRSALKRET
jgi:DNA-binding MarR family transcriptional regulator